MRLLPITLAAAICAAITSAPASAGVIANSSTPGSKIEVVDLKRDGAGGVTLTLTITNTTTKDLDLACDLRADGNESCKQVAGIYLIDGVNKKRYLVMRDTTGKCLCTDTLTKISPMGSVTIWAKFPAPPTTVTTVSAIVPTFLPLDAVPLTGP
jgi:hypothetical protein